MGEIHKIEPGDSVTSLADIKGYAPKTIWSHPENEPLRSQRENMNILADDDKIFIPELRNKSIPCRTAMRHRFRRIGVPAFFRLQLLLDGQPRKNLRYVLAFEGSVIENQTDERGMIEVFIPPSIKEMQLFIGDEEEPRTLKVGTLDPASTITGVQQRLQNLGYESPLNGTFDEATQAALWAFQQRSDITPTGERDAETIEALRRAHDVLGGNS